MASQDRPLKVLPSNVTRFITEDQMDGLRDARDGLADSIRNAQRQLDNLYDYLSRVSPQVTGERTK